MRAPMLLAILVFGAGLTGCIGGDEAPDADSVDKASTPAASSSAAAALPPAATPLDVTLSGSTAWARPGEAATFTATSKGATSYEWFLAARPAAAADGGGGGSAHSGHILQDATVDDHLADAKFGPGHAETKPARQAPSKLDTGELQPGTYSEPLTVPEEGLYQFHCHPHPWMALNIATKEGASATGTQHVQIVDGANQDEFRYVPNELVVAPGTQIVFWNNGTNMHTGTQGGFAWLIPQIGPSISYAPPDEGDFDVLVVARDDATGRGEARVRILVDSTKPNEIQTVGPYQGSFKKGVANDPQPEVMEHPFSINFPARTLTFTYEATSTLPASGAKVSVTLLQGTTELATAPASADGELKVENLPAGSYTLRVMAAEGVLIDYTAKGTAELDLTPPESTASGGSGGHH